MHVMKIDHALRDVQLRVEGDRELRDEADRKRRGEQRGEDPEPVAYVAIAEPARKEVDDERADGETEERDGDRDEREVVPHGHAEDPSQHDLVHKRREGDEEQPGIRAGAGATGRGEISGGGQADSFAASANTACSSAPTGLPPGERLSS